MTKYAIIVPDGAADEPIEQLGGRTVLESADIPNMNLVSSQGLQGLVRTIPEGMEPGSDVAQMSLLGYDPVHYYSGRAPIEAVARGIELSEDDWVFRCNLVTIVDGLMADHSAGHISTVEAEQLIKQLNEYFGSERIRFYSGLSYRNLVVMKGFDFDVKTCPPHDFIGRAVEKILPRGRGCEVLIDLMARSQQLFSDNDINRVRSDLGENPVSSIWLWGQGRRASLEDFQKRFGLRGAAITAVDLVKGLAKLAGLELIEVAGATGFVDTNYEGKGAAAVKALKDYDLVFVHIEAPDEAAHSGSVESKKKAVEQIDRYVVGPVLKALQGYPQWRILIAPDHPTPVSTCAHSAEPVPFAIAGTGISGVLKADFSESNAARAGLKIEKGCELMEYFLKS